MGTLTNLVVVGAHGRDYHSRNTALLTHEWERGLQFKICNGHFITKHDVPSLIADGYTQITFMARDGLRVCVMDLATQQLLPEG